MQPATTAQMPEDEGKTYIHLIGPAAIRHDGKRFIIEFADVEGNPLDVEGRPILEPDAKDTPKLSLEFKEDTELLKLMNMHLIVEVWNETLADKITTLNKAFPHLKVVAQANDVIVQVKEEDKQDQAGAVKTQTIAMRKLDNFMTPTDPPKQNGA